jgi:hypothetical protein
MTGVYRQVVVAVYTGEVVGEALFGGIAMMLVDRVRLHERRHRCIRGDRSVATACF